MGHSRTGGVRRAEVILISLLFFLGSLVIVPGVVEADPGPGDWMIVIVDSTDSVGTYTSIAIDSNDKVHISYRDTTNQDLKYATNADGSWVCQTIDSFGDVGEHTSIAIDSQDKVHISYRDITNQDLKYATNADGSWVCQTIDSGGSVGEWTAIGIDSNDKVHISYRDTTNQDLKYANNAGGSWINQTVDSAGSVGEYTSIGLDSDDNVHISYWDTTNQDLKYATNAGGSWSNETIDPDISSGGWTSIALDSQDKVHISYQDIANQKLMYATNSGGDWSCEIADPGVYQGGSTSIVIDSQDKVHISCYVCGDLFYSTNHGGSWSNEIVRSVGIVGRYCSIFLDSQDRVYISYYDDSYLDLKYATRRPGDISIQTIDDSVGNGHWSSLAVDSNDKVHMSYLDAENYDLRYATNAGGSWSCQTLDDEGLVGDCSSIAIDSNDKVHISYRDITNQDLKYATNAGGSWTCQTIDSAGADDINAVIYTSIAIDSNDKVHISYRDTSTLDLRYATNSGGSWSCQTIDSGGAVGEYSSIAVDSEDKVHISYFDHTEQDLKYATNAGGSWSCQTLDSEGSIGLFTSIAIDSDDNAHISYFASDYIDLKYATNAGGSWGYQTVDEGDAGWYTSIAIDSQDMVHISHRTYLMDLRYTTNALGAWSSMTLDSGAGGAFQSCTPMAVDSDNRVHISYYQPTTSHLTYLLMYIKPSAALELRCSSGDSYVQLHWSPPLLDAGYPVEGYAVYCGNEPEGLEFLCGTTSPEHNHTSAVNGETYYYQVRACNIFGEGAASNLLKVIPGTVPSAPLSIQAEAGDSHVLLSWDPPSDNGGSSVEGYNIYRGIGEASLDYLTSTYVAQFDDTSLTNGVIYRYQVSAVNAIGEGARSDIASATPVTIPSAPQGLQAEAGNAFVLLTWIAPSDDGGSEIEGYYVYRGVNKASLNLLTSVTGLSYNDTSVTNDVAYYYKVSALTAIGEGPRSNMVKAQPRVEIVITAPSAPLSLEAQGQVSQVLITWDPPEDNGGATITNFIIFRGTVPGEANYLKLIGNALEYLDTDVNNGTTYYYQVSAVNAKGEGARSNEASAAPIDIVPPSAPAIIAYEAGGSYVHLTWSAPVSDGGAEVIGFNVYRGKSALSLEFLTTVTAPYLNDTSVTNGVAYYYQVTAFNSIGEGEGSGVINATPLAVPSSPNGLQSEAGNGYVLLDWLRPSDDGGTGIDGYRIYRGEGGPVLALLTTVSTLQYNDTSVSNNVTYHYRVSAVNPSGEGPMSDMITATPRTGLVKTVPTAPLDLEADPGELSITLSWGLPEDNGGAIITHYLVYRGTSSGSKTPIATVDDALELTDDSITSNVIYYYQVSAVNVMGEGALSNEVVSTTSAMTVPSAPTDLTAIPGDRWITLSWAVPEDDGGSPMLHYRIYRGSASGSETLLATIGNALSFTDTGLVNGIAYYYRVSAMNGVGSGPLSAEVLAAPVQPVAPFSPQDLLAEAGDGFVLLAWEPPSNDGGAPIIGYSIYRGNSSGPLSLLVTLGNVLEYNDTDVTNGATYHYRIAAFNKAGEGPVSDTVSITPEAAFVPMVPSEPLNPQASAGDGYVLITWTVPLDDGGSDITSYNIYRGQNETTLVLLVNVPAAQISYNDTSVENGRTYYYRVTAVNSEGEGNATEVLSATLIEEGGDNTMLLAAIGVLAIIGAVGAALIVMHRKR